MAKELKGRIVNLIDLGVKGNSLVAYKAPDNKYYSSEEAYLKIKQDKEYWTKSMDKLMEVLDYQKGMALPTIAAKKFSSIRSYGMDVVYDTICDCENNGAFDYAKTIEFGSEYQRVSYYASIIVNHVGDLYKNKSYRKKVEEKQHDNPMDEDTVEYVPINKKKNISRFLED